MAPTGRPLDIVLLGATGYTGTFTTEHITKECPTNLNWAVAGRSADKLSTLVADLQKRAPDRKPPTVRALQMNEDELNALARETTVMINCVGPYHMYSSPVVAACVNNGTHYLDVTGEIPWVREMINKHHGSAKSQGTVLISAVGMESVPAELLSWTLADKIKSQYGVVTKEAILSCYQMKTAGVSGGTLATMLTLPVNTPAKEMKAAMDRYSIADFRPTVRKSPPLLRRLFGVFSHPHLGTMTTAFAAMVDLPIIQRGASLLPSLYDRNFQAQEYMNVPNAFVGMLVHFALITGALLVRLSIVRWILQRVITAPGAGPSRESTVGNRIEFRGIATGEKNGKPVRVLGRLAYEGDAYSLTGLTLTQAAMTLLQEKQLVKSLGGGYLTPAMLGEEFVRRLRDSGFVIEANPLD